MAVNKPGKLQYRYCWKDKQWYFTEEFLEGIFQSAEEEAKKLSKGYKAQRMWLPNWIYHKPIGGDFFNHYIPEVEYADTQNSIKA